jgi:hypothetical protein
LLKSDLHLVVRSITVNWYHRHFEITFSFLEGRKNATVMYQKAGQEFIDNNIYTGIPLTVNNSEGA